MRNQQKSELSKLSFEDALEKLESIVDKMEDGNLPLDQMIKCFEEGSALSNMCSGKLKELEKKIEILVKATSDGGDWEAFDPETKMRVTENPETEDESQNDDSKDKDMLF